MLKFNKITYIQNKIAYNINNIDLLILGQIKNSQTERLENFFKNKFNKIYIVGFSNIFNMDGKILQKIYLNKKLIFTKEFSIKYKEIKNEMSDRRVQSVLWDNLLLPSCRSLLFVSNLIDTNR